ncbi:MAG: ABC transporter permease [Promethearchaeia archaeon]
MSIVQSVKENASQILAITEKNVKLHLRYKSGILFGFINPIIAILIPLVIMGNLFQFNNQFGEWTSENFLIYQFIAYDISLLKSLVNVFPKQFQMEKFWKTLPALIIGPFNRINLLFSILLSHLIIISPPFITIMVMCYVFYPISFGSFFFFLFTLFLISLIFSGIGITLGVFAISNENLLKVFNFLIGFVFLFSCITYPFEIFPDFIQNIININPLYYVFDFLRMIWIHNDIILTISSLPYHFFILLICAVSIPIIGILIFSKIYKKYGITGF